MNKKEVAVQEQDFELAAAYRDEIDARIKKDPTFRESKQVESKMNKFVVRIQGKGRFSFIPYTDRDSMLKGVATQGENIRGNGGTVTFATDAEYKIKDRFEVCFTVFEGDKIIAPRFAGGTDDELGAWLLAGELKG